MSRGSDKRKPTWESFILSVGEISEYCNYYSEINRGVFKEKPGVFGIRNRVNLKRKLNPESTSSAKRKIAQTDNKNFIKCCWTDVSGT